MKSKRLVAILALAAFATLAGSDCDNQSSAAKQDEELSEQILRDLQRAHPVPQFRRSQIRQNLVELTTAQAETTQTTSFFFNMGVAEPVNSCPSIGFPIPATMQLTNPEQIARSYSGGYAILPQVEPTGVFTGNTTGTYAICVNAQGQAYAQYWEGFVMAVTGPAEFRDGQVELVGPPSFNFTAEGSEDAVVEEGDPDFSTETESEVATVEE